MGYRSDVRIVMSKNGYKEFKKYVNKHTKNYVSKEIKPGTVVSLSNYDYNMLNSLDVSKETIDGKQVYIGWDSVKWYEGYEEIDAIMDSLNKLEENGYGFNFARSGESYDDYESINAASTSKDGIKHLDYPSLDRCFCDFEYNDIDLSKERRKDDRDAR